MDRAGTSGASGGSASGERRASGIGGEGAEWVWGVIVQVVLGILSVLMLERDVLTWGQTWI